MCDASGSVQTAIPSGADRRARLAVCLLYVIMSATNGMWATRIPDIRVRIGADDAGWGLINTVAGIGGLLAVAAVAVVVRHVDIRRLAIIGGTLMLVNTPLLGAASSLWTAFVTIQVWFCTSCMFGVPMGVLALGVQRRYQRPLMGSFTACFAIGSLAGAGFGTLAASLRVSPEAQFTVSTAMLLPALAVMCRWLPRDERAQEPATLPGLRRRLTRQLAVIAALGLFAQFVTTGCEQWTVYYAARTLGAGGAFGAAVYLGMSIAGAVAVLFVDGATRRFGRLRLFKAAVLVAAGVLAIGLAINTPAAAMAAFIVVGICTVCVGPTLYTLAGDHRGTTIGEAVSVLELGDSGGALLAPVLIGAFASATSLRFSLFTIPIALVGLSIGAPRVATANSRAAQLRSVHVESAP